MLVARSTLSAIRATRDLRLVCHALIALFCLLTGSGIASENTPAAPVEVVSWVRAHARPFETVEAGRGFVDLEPLRAMIGTARIVALGEPTHGSREVFQLKHRVVEFLVTELGFTAFAIEANMPEARHVDDYVSRSQGDPADLIRGMRFWTWSTEEVRALVENLHEFNFDPANQHAGRHVEFAGFDMQDSRVASTFVHDYVAAHDAQFLATVDAAIAALKPGSRDSFGFTTGTSAGRALELWHGIEVRLAKSASRIPASAEAVAATWATQYAHIVVQSLALDATPLVFRDESMARNVEWLLAQNPHAKIVLWAHNEHVKREPEAMGGYLSQRFGGDLVVVGFATGHGAYRARGQRGDHALGSFPLQMPPAGSVESVFAATRLPLFMVDLRSTPTDAAARWLLDDHPLRSIGAMELTGEFQFRPASVARNYDLMFWIEQTSPTVPLPGGWPPMKK